MKRGGCARAHSCARWTSVCVLANDLTGAARGGTGFDSCVLAGIEGNEFVVVSQIEPPVRTEKHQRTEVRSRRPVTSQRRRSRSSRWVQLSRRVNLKWTRRDGSLTFNIRGARKSGPTARRSGVGKIGGHSVVCRRPASGAWSSKLLLRFPPRDRSTQDDRSSRPSENSMRSKSSRFHPSGEPVDPSSAPNGFRETRLSQQTRFPRRKSANFVVVWP